MAARSSQSEGPSRTKTGLKTTHLGCHPVQGRHIESSPRVLADRGVGISSVRCQQSRLDHDLQRENGCSWDIRRWASLPVLAALAACTASKTDWLRTSNASHVHALAATWR